METQEQVKETVQPNIAISYNHTDPVLADRVRIELSLDYLAKSDVGTTLLRGLAEEFKIELLEVLRLKRLRNQGNGKIIIPKVH